MRTKTWMLLLTVALTAPWCTGCQNDAQTGALAGGLIGAGGGAAIGAGVDHKNRGRGALIGAGIGAAAGTLGGYIVGSESDKKKAEHDNTY